MISQFYWEKIFVNENIFWARAGSGRAELKLNRIGRASRILGPLWAGPGHEKVARFEPWCVCVCGDMNARRSGQEIFIWKRSADKRDIYSTEENREDESILETSVLFRA